MTIAAGKIGSIGVIGGGAWGTALAQTMALAGRDVRLWAFEPDTVREINDYHINRVFLPGVEIDRKVRATAKLDEAAACDVVLLVPPAQHLRRIATELAGHLPDGRPVVVCAKGIEQATGKLMGEVVSEVLPNATKAVLSGPSFAADVARGLPAAVTLACEDEQDARTLAEGLGYRNFRIYSSTDTTGVELGGAVKNVLAIAAGIVDGRELGASAHAALVARGFSELRRLGEALDASPETLMGLSGLGDLILTCSSPQSRNMSLGRALGQGRTIRQVLGERRAVTEGVFTSEAVARIAEEKEIDLPICAAVHAIVKDRVSVEDAIEGLLSRPQRAES
ncbi:MAG: NAD(P)-dependent glycerol-3-phosphate dehydrogenase [Alphaproteobacteria bacterium]|nr:NAD(P)-dependent glycerol-3-phosphate dehydrogenase [Alphaproteobacteria bacterium]